MAIARVQPRGQVTIPQLIRKGCGIEPGSDLLFIQTGSDRFECHRLPAQRSLLELIDEYSGDGVAPDMAQLHEEMGDEIAEEVLGDRVPGDAAPV